MKTTIKKIAGLILFLFLGLNSVNAQFFKTIKEIITEYGYDYQNGKLSSGEVYLIYEDELTTEISGTFTRKMLFFFDKETDMCVGTILFEPLSEKPKNVAFYKNSRAIEIGYQRWKDLKLNIIYKVEEENGLCVITSLYDLDDL
jgi:hypothetical protein